MNRESINLSYFDKNKELSIDLHYEMYRNIKDDIYAIASHYPIDFVIAETEVIKKSNEILENLIKYIEDKIKEYQHKFDIAKSKKQYEIAVSVRLEFQDLLERIKNNNYEKSNIK